MLNNITIHGRLVRNPEMRITQSGVPMCNFTVAVDRSFRQGEEKKADFFDCVVWRGLADLVGKHFTKGKEIVVTGAMQSNKWKDKDGNDRISWSILGKAIDFCGNKSGDVVPPQPAGTSFGFEEIPNDGDALPF